MLASLRSLGLSKPQREKSRPVLMGLATIETEPVELRLTALEALGDQVGELPPALLEIVTASLTEETPPLQRAAAASVLANASRARPGAWITLADLAIVIENP